MERPLVSVVTIFLDAERFLAEAIESVLAQDYPTWELLLVDDGSTDASAAIARGYAARAPQRIRYVTHPGRRNLGMSASRNLGLAHARGPLVAFLDADDVWLPHKLAEQVRLLGEHPRAAMVYGATRLWHGWTGRATDAARDELRALGVAPGTLAEPPLLVQQYLRVQGLPPAVCGVLARRAAVAAVAAVGAFEPKFRGLYEDQVFFYKFALAYPVLVESGTWDLYRQHPNSHCHAAGRAGLYSDRRPTEARRQFLE